jgi:pyruvate/2-oxoglutarate/acetoin dehydrogenase E1 component
MDQKTKLAIDLLQKSFFPSNENTYPYDAFKVLLNTLAKYETDLVSIGQNLTKVIDELKQTKEENKELKIVALACVNAIDPEIKRRSLEELNRLVLL